MNYSKFHNITIRRIMPNNKSPEDVKILRSMRWVISAVGDKTTGGDLTGLTKEELDKYMPIVTSTTPTSDEYNKVCREYWANLVLKVPDEGVTLNIQIGPDGNPINLQDWLNYKRAIKHPQVAKSKSDAEGDKSKRFYIYDPEAEIKAKQDAITSKMEADRLYMEIQSDDIKVSYILLGMGKSNIHRLNTAERQVELYDLKEKQPKLFTELSKDKNLQYKAEVQLVLDEGSIKRTNTGYYFGSGSDEIHLGDTIQDVIRFITKPENSGTYLRMKGIIQGMNIAFAVNPKKAQEPKAGVQLERQVSEVNEETIETEDFTEEPKPESINVASKRGPKSKS